MNRDCTICQDEISQGGCLSHRLDHHPMDFENYVVSRWRSSNATDDDQPAGQPLCEWIKSAENDEDDERWLVLMWSLITIISCIPMTLSTIYKEVVLDDLDPIFLNGWIVIFQTFYSLILMAPAGLVSSPVVRPSELWENLLDGFKCYAYGVGSIETGCHPDSDCEDAAFYFNSALIINTAYVLSMMAVIRMGSTALLFLALTIMVPLGNLAFAVPSSFVPASAQTTIHFSDFIGLVVIIGGIMLYRFTSSSNESEETSPALLQQEGQEPPEGGEDEHEDCADQINAADGQTSTSRTSSLRRSSRRQPRLSSDNDDLQEPLLPDAPRTGDV